jgi:NAD(P)-dependent dehydrogenase (short-subunit alcohol dehydrogenase family)
VSASADPSTLLRPDLLDGVSMLFAAAAGDDSRVAQIGSDLADLGASVSHWRAPRAESGDSQTAATAQDVDVLVVDAAAMFAGAGINTEAGAGNAPIVTGTALSACLDGAWQVTQAVATAAFIGPGRPGRVVYLAPTADAGEHAEAACAGLENLARTLSIEWARYAITTVTIAPGASMSVGELAALVGYLASPAGAYFSGCLLDLRGPGAAG